jgi:DNA-binding ferritin-like protein (Dps family)
MPNSKLRNRKIEQKRVNQKLVDDVAELNERVVAIESPWANVVGQDVSTVIGETMETITEIRDGFKDVTKKARQSRKSKRRLEKKSRPVR